MCVNADSAWRRQLLRGREITRLRPDDTSTCNQPGQQRMALAQYCVFVPRDTLNARTGEMLGLSATSNAPRRNAERTSTSDRRGRRTWDPDSVRECNLPSRIADAPRLVPALYNWEPDAVISEVPASKYFGPTSSKGELSTTTTITYKWIIIVPSYMYNHQ
eukprot:6178091-Pleurochrysis_carterae.AAC.2